MIPNKIMPTAIKKKRIMINLYYKSSSSLMVPKIDKNKLYINEFALKMRE